MVIIISKVDELLTTVLKNGDFADIGYEFPSKYNLFINII